MSKFSIIVSVYHAENHICRCLESIFNQTYEDYEVIIVNDGKYSKIIQKYHEQYPDKIKIMHIKNAKDMSVRGRAIRKISGDYVLFIDCDDYIEKGLLKTLNSKLKDCPDIIRFQVKEIHKNKVCMYRELPFETVKGSTAFEKIKKYYYVNDIQFYLYKKEFIAEFYKKYLKYISDDFFALGSFLILQAKKVKSIGYIGYIIEKDDKEIANSPMELLQQYSNFSKYLNTTNADNLAIWQSYVADLLLKETVYLKSKKYKEYLLALNENNVLNIVKQTGFEKWLICNHPKIYFKLKKER